MDRFHYFQTSSIFLADSVQRDTHNRCTVIRNISVLESFKNQIRPDRRPLFGLLSVRRLIGTFQCSPERINQRETFV